jgi:hypothetical protein
MEFPIANMCLHVAHETVKICTDPWYREKANILISKSYEMDRCFISGSKSEYADLLMRLVILGDCISSLTYLLQMTILDEFSSLKSIISRTLFDCTELAYNITIFLVQQ